MGNPIFCVIKIIVCKNLHTLKDINTNSGADMIDFLKKEYLYNEENDFENFEFYKRFGVFLLSESKEEYKYLFRTFAEGVDSVELTGDFNMWGRSKLDKKGGGVFEVEIESDIPLDGTCYKYRICRGDDCHMSPDPFARYSRRGSSDSIIFTKNEYLWNDERWESERSETYTDQSGLAFPLNIYEVHLGSWKKEEGGISREGYLNYRDIAGLLSEYVFDMGYTHISVLSLIGEENGHSGGYFEPSSKYGSPEDFKAFVDTLHNNGIGVILDFKMDERLTFRDEFYISSALFWLDEFHIDGLKISICNNDGKQNYSERKNAVDEIRIAELLRKLNSQIDKKYPDRLKISGRMPVRFKDNLRFTDSVEDQGLGFDLAVNFGWSANTLEYENTENGLKSYKYGRLGYSLMHSFGEKYVISVDASDVSSGRGSLLSQMIGDYREKIEHLKLFLTYMMMHPGKKQTFMGCEIGELNEWERHAQLEWFWVDYEPHKEIKDHVRRLNKLYAEKTALWSHDCSWRGFEWHSTGNEDKRVIAFSRLGEKGKRIVAIFNFSSDSFERSNVELSYADAEYKTLLSCGYVEENEAFRTDENGILTLDVPEISALILERIEK